MLRPVALALLLTGAIALTAAAETVEVTASALNVRSGPGPNYSRVTLVYRGQRFAVLARSSGWVRLRASGREGWSSGSYLKTVGGAAPAAPAATVMIVNASALNVRSGPSTNYRRLGQLTRGTRVQVTGTSGAWRRIDFQGRAGWVHGDYLGAAGAAAPTPSGPAAWDLTPPSADYRRTTFRGVRVNARTIDLVLRAERIMADLGRPGFRFSFSQGSYSGSVAASGGTHAGGGALDIRTRGQSRATVDIMVRALRRAGFAAWSRGRGYDSFAPHIHALAIGDRELSSAARSQVSSYARGRNGLRNQALDADRHLGREAPTWARGFL